MEIALPERIGRTCHEKSHVLLRVFHQGCNWSMVFFLLLVLLRLLLKTSLVKILVKVTNLGPFASKRRPFGPCYG